MKPHSEAHDHLARNVPDLEDLIRNIGPLPRITRSRIPIPEAIARITIGQMLSGKAANSIYARLREEARRRGLKGVWELDSSTLRRLGLSSRKARTITEFSDAYRQAPNQFRKWTKVPTAELFAEVGRFWGLSTWSAAMIGIFHLGHEDVFPTNDGSIIRALQFLYAPKTFALLNDFPEASPYRSYLSLYLWKGLDEGRLAKHCTSQKRK